MKRIVSTLFLLIAILLFILFFVVGRIMDDQMNVCLHIDDEDYEISKRAEKLHESLIIADWHSDVLLWDRNILAKATHGHTDVPRLMQGNFTLQVFDAVIKSPRGLNYERNSGDTDNITLLAMANRWPIKSWFSLFERAIYQSNKLFKASAQSEGKLRVITNKIELQQLLADRKTNKDIVGGLLSIEGLHAIENDINHLEGLYDAGYRMLGLVHFFDNEVGGSSAGVDQYGLTDLGKSVIQRMDQMKMIIDLAHSSTQLIDDVLSYTDSPVVISHSGVKGTYDSPRNLSDKHIKMIAARGGIIGIGFWDGAIGSSSVSKIVNTMRYVADLVGVDHVSLGSDWDGGTTTHFDAAHISILTEELLKQEFSEEEIRGIMGQNQIGFLLSHLP